MEFTTEHNDTLERSLPEDGQVPNGQQQDLDSSKMDPIEEPPPPEPVDAHMELKVSADRMEAYLVTYPPENGGKDLLASDAWKLVRSSGIVYGLQENALGAPKEQIPYDVSILVAQGTRAVDGIDGRLNEYYSRERKIRPQEIENGNVNFKDMNIVTNITKTTVICDIIPPVPMIPGKDIYGYIANGTQGAAPFVPQGWNTKVNAKGDKLLADCDGNLIFADGRFRIEDTLHINGSVNNEVGNIDFCGKVIIDGDVREGFVVKSKKSVDIRGSVEGATVIAKENITIIKGMNGMGKGILDAGGNISCRFLENTTAKAGGSIIADSILNSTIFSDDKVVISGRRGVLVGGTATAKNLIEAKAVGTAAGIPTYVVLGISQEMLAEFKAAQKEFETTMAQIEELTKDIAYLEQRDTGSILSPERKAMLAEKRRKKTVDLMRSSSLSKQIKRYQEHVESALTCRLNCNQVFPAVQIRISNAQFTTRITESQCSFYYSQGNIIKGLL